MQAGDPPHWDTIPICTAGATYNKKVLNVVDPHDSIPLDNEAHPVTTFITEWEIFIYLRMPQGYLASGVVYTRRYAKIIKDTPCKVKIVNDTIYTVYDSSTEKAFYHTCISSFKDGIVLNTVKFYFFQLVVQFRSLQIAPSWVTPSESMIQVILNFPVPRTITDAGSWFELIIHVPGLYSLGPNMLPFSGRCQTELQIRLEPKS